MIDLTTDYLGLKLANPLVPSASPLTKDVNSARKLEDAGASAVVMYSLFEEKIEAEERQIDRFLYQQALGHGEADSFYPMPAHVHTYQEQYLEQLEKLKAALEIPVIASLNGTSLSGWVEYGKQLQQAGADALELNIYHLAANAEESSVDVENRYLDILQELKVHVSVPIVMKLSSQFSSPIHFAKRLEEAGASGIALFNRFYQPDINLDNLSIDPRADLSTAAEIRVPLLWIAVLYGRIKASLAASRGIHSSTEVIKYLLAGADVVTVASALMKNGPQYLNVLVKETDRWLTARDYHSLAEVRGVMSRQNVKDPGAFERVNYIKVLESFENPFTSGRANSRI